MNCVLPWERFGDPRYLNFTKILSSVRQGFSYFRTLSMGMMVGFLQYRGRNKPLQIFSCRYCDNFFLDKSWIAHVGMSVNVIYHQHFALSDLHSVMVDFLFSSLPALTAISVFSVSPLPDSGPSSVCCLRARVPLKPTAVIPNPLSAVAHLNHDDILPLYLPMTLWLFSFSCLSCCSFFPQRSNTPTVLSIMEGVSISAQMTLPTGAAFAAVHPGTS